jgi:hypothetical protein
MALAAATVFVVAPCSGPEPAFTPALLNMVAGANHRLPVRYGVGDADLDHGRHGKGAESGY